MKPKIIDVEVVTIEEQQAKQKAYINLLLDNAEWRLKKPTMLFEYGGRLLLAYPAEVIKELYDSVSFIKTKSKL